jgi:hypothetical protein
VRKQTIASVTTRADQTAAHLAHAAHLLTDRKCALVERARRELPKLAEDLPLAFRHGDFAPATGYGMPTAAPSHCSTSRAQAME